MPTLSAASILPPRLDALLDALVASTRHAVVIRGWSADCTDGEHRFEVWIEGVYAGLLLTLLACTDCATVEVRDRSIDRLAGLPVGALALRRRDELLGWYSGVRRAGRIYHAMT